MTAEVVLRQTRMHEARAAVGRQRDAVASIDSAAVPQPDPVCAAREAAWEQGLAEGRAAGFRQGHEEGFAKGAAEAAAAAQASRAEAAAQAAAVLAERARQLSDVLVSARGAIQDQVAAAEDEMVALCFETLARVLGTTLVTPEGVRAQVLQLLQQAGSDRMVAIHVHPGVADTLEALCTDTLAELEIIRDTEVAVGGCVLHGAHGALDARLATILEEVAAALLARDAA